MKEIIISQITTECPWRDTLYWYDTLDSTNTRAKAMAKEGAPHGTVLVAGAQTGGRGRMGRSFDSQNGAGVYLSVILRPGCAPKELMHLTCAVGVSLCEAVEKASGLNAQLKWINDLVLGKRKLGGILTELSIHPQTGLIEYAVIGVGINCLQTRFPRELDGIATSLSIAGKPVSPAVLAGAVTESLWKLDGCLLSEKERIMDRYRNRCITLGQDIQILRGDVAAAGKALDVDSEGALTVQLSDGSTVTVSSGEVSVRGMYGYI